MSTIGIIGAGHIGSQVARLAVASGYDVVISNSRGPETLSDARRGARSPGPRRDAGRSRRRRRTSSSSPFRSRPTATVPVEPLAGKIVIDTNNYYPQRDGQIPELDNDSTTTRNCFRRTCRSRRWSRRSTTSMRPNSICTSADARAQDFGRNKVQYDS